MDYDTFVNRVQARGRLESREEAVTAIRATLETLGERLVGGDRKDLCSQVPREIAYYLSRATRSEKLSLEDFHGRVAVREPCELSQAIFHARVVMSALQDAISPGAIADVRAQLPPEFDPLFEHRKFVHESPIASSLARDQMQDEDCVSRRSPTAERCRFRRAQPTSHPVLTPWCTAGPPCATIHFASSCAARARDDAVAVTPRPHREIRARKNAKASASDKPAARPYLLRHAVKDE